MNKPNLKVKILLLDDETEIIETFSLLMKQFHYDADFFTEPEKALEAIRISPSKYSIIISDIRMPKMNGVALAKQVRTIAPHMPIIFMTGFSSEDVEEEIKALGNAKLLSKPFHLESTFSSLIPTMISASK